MGDNSSKVIKKAFEGSLVVIIVSMITAAIGMLVDGIMIGSFLGVECLAAYGIVSPASLIISFIGGTLGTGIQTVCSRYIGRGDIARANGVFNAATIVGIVVSLLFGVVIFAFATPLAELLGATGSSSNLLPLTRDYLYGVAISVPALTLATSMQPAMHLDGDRGRIFYAVVGMTIVNVIGNFVNIFVLKGGMFGMSISTAVSYYFAVFIFLLHFTKKSSSFKLQVRDLPWNTMPSIVFEGLPKTLLRIYGPIRTLLFNNLLLTLSGTAAVAAFSVQANMVNLFGVIGAGIGVAALMIFSYLNGEEDVKGTRSLMRTATVEGFIIVTISSIALFVLAPFLVSMYITDPVATEIAITCLRLYAISLPLDLVVQVYMSFLQGSHHLTYTHIVCIFDELIFVVALAYAFGFAFGLDAVWWSFAVGQLLMFVLIFLIAAYEKRGIPCSVRDLLLIKDDFGTEEDMRFEMSLQSLDQLVTASESAYEFCSKRGMDSKTCYYSALFIEEMGANIIKYGFTPNKSNSVDLRLTVKRDGELIIRFRDNCRPLEPRKWVDIHYPDDPTANIGIRMIYEHSKDVTNTYTLGMNMIMIHI